MQSADATDLCERARSRSLSTLLVFGAVTPPLCGGDEEGLNEGGANREGAGGCNVVYLQEDEGG